jgi:hypothetical protein
VPRSSGAGNATRSQPAGLAPGAAAPTPRSIPGRPVPRSGGASAAGVAAAAVGAPRRPAGASAASPPAAAAALVAQRSVRPPALDVQPSARRVERSSASPAGAAGAVSPRSPQARPSPRTSQSRAPAVWPPPVHTSTGPRAARTSGAGGAMRSPPAQAMDGAAPADKSAEDN